MLSHSGISTTSSKTGLPYLDGKKTTQMNLVSVLPWWTFDAAILLFCIQNNIQSPEVMQTLIGL
jgi:hypothetical protein